MKRNLRFFQIFIYLLLSNFAFANGGPVDMSHFRKTGNIRLLQNADISLLKEDLRIKVIGDYTEIEVDYTLQNDGKMQQIQYGFPVDAYAANWTYGEGVPAFSKYNDCLKYFEVWENGKAVKVSQWIVDSVYKVKTIDIRENPNYHNQSYFVTRKWSAITLNFEQNEVKTLTINYKIKNTLRDKIPGFCYVHRFTDRHFMYHLTPSSKWGNGIVKDFSVRIDVSDLIEDNCDFAVTGLDSLMKQDNIYSFSITNYDLKKSDRINIHYDNRHLKMTAFINETQYANQVIKSIKSSSNNTKIRNLIDDNPATTWIGKRGDWIEIEFQPNTTICGVLWLNGDYSKEENFERSGKVSRAKVIVNDNLVFKTSSWEGETTIIQLEKPTFRTVKPNNIKGLATIVADGERLYITSYQTFKRIKTVKIRIEIIETLADKNGRITLSELYFVGK